jgi:hypothetical protein
MTYSRRGLREPFVYFCVAAQENEVKIGYSVNPTRRRLSLESTRHANLELFATIKGGAGIERKMHKRFAEYRIHGEWFEASPELMAFIYSLRMDVAYDEAIQFDAIYAHRQAKIRKQAAGDPLAASPIQIVRNAAA